MKKESRQMKLDKLLERGDQAAYEEQLAAERDRRQTTKAERQEARRREDALESMLDNMDF